MVAAGITVLSLGFIRSGQKVLTHDYANHDHAPVIDALAEVRDDRLTEVIIKPLEVTAS